MRLAADLAAFLWKVAIVSRKELRISGYTDDYHYLADERERVGEPDWADVPTSQKGPPEFTQAELWCLPNRSRKMVLYLARLRNLRRQAAQVAGA